MAKDLKKLLAISWSMPPLHYPRSIQVSRLLKGLSEIGWESTVLCADPSQHEQDTSILALVSDSYKCIPVFTPPHKLYLQDALSSEWMEPAVNKASQCISNQKFDALVTFAQPWVDHLIGLKLRKSFNIPWVAHFSDPWIDSPYYASFDRKTLQAWSQLEFEIISNSDRVVFTNRQALDLVMAKYPTVYQEKSVVIPHCYDRSIVNPHPQNESTSSKRLKMVYTGDFYGIRSPEYFFSAVNKLGKTYPLKEILEIHLIGNCVPEFQKKVKKMNLEAIIHFSPKLPYIESLVAASNADILLLIDAPSKIPSPFLPSKLVDYLSQERLILGITPDRGASADLLHLLGCPVVDPEDTDAIALVMEKIIKDWQNGQIKLSPAFHTTAAFYDVASVSQRFSEILLSAINK